jgi:hypothetical protein
MAALALALDTSVPALFLADAAPIELPAAAVSAEDYQRIVLYAGDEAPLDGIEELVVALHDQADPVATRPGVAGQDRTGSGGSRQRRTASTRAGAHAPVGAVPPAQADDQAGGSRQGVNAAAARLLATEMDQGA